MANQYEAARDIYAAAWGVDITEEAPRKMDTIPVSINCWRLDDLTGFEDFDAARTGGIAVTGNAPGKPRSVEEYFCLSRQNALARRVRSIWSQTRFIRSQTA